MLTSLGIHKHFRMIALSEHLRNHGYDPAIEKHTRIPGIWGKLRTLYNLPIIDDRENSFEYEDVGKFIEFMLPEEDFAEDTFMRGKRKSPSEAPSSPPRLGRSPSPAPQGTRKRKRADTAVTAKNRASTVDDTDETRTSPANSPPPKMTRGGRSLNRTVGRVKAESSSRQQSKDTTVTEDDGAEETEEPAEDDEPEAEEEDGTPSPRAAKGTSKVKADPPATRKSRRKR